MNGLGTGGPIFPLEWVQCTYGSIDRICFSTDKKYNQGMALHIDDLFNEEKDLFYYNGIGYDDFDIVPSLKDLRTSRITVFDEALCYATMKQQQETKQKDGPRYALLHQTISGWEFIGSCGNELNTYPSFQEAEQDLIEDVREHVRQYQAGDRAFEEIMSLADYEIVEVREEDGYYCAYNIGSEASFYRESIEEFKENKT